MARLAWYGVSSSSASPVKAVLFDFDGTLWDPEPQIFQSYTELFREYGCVLSISLWSSVIGTIGFDLLTHLENFADTPVNRVRATEEVQRRCAALLSTVTIRPGIHRLLEVVDA